MSTAPHRHGLLSVCPFLCVFVAFALTWVLNSCSSDSDDADVAGAYSEVLRWFVDRGGPHSERPVVFIEPRGEGLDIGLDTQAAVISAADGFAEVRFIDDRSEALDEEGVRDGGIFIALGPGTQDRDLLIVECDEILAEDDELSWSFTLRYRDGQWSRIGTPQPI